MDIASRSNAEDLVDDHSVRSQFDSKICVWHIGFNMAELQSSTTLDSARSAAPIVKWAGGKKQLLSTLTARLPRQWERYFEPFSGGAALFFSLQPREAMLLDTNPELVDAYLAVRDELDALIDLLRMYRYDKERYYEVRAQSPEGLTRVQRAARFLYLNRTCFNGLYRVNRKGQFNVPFGRYQNPRICDVPRLTAASRALQHADIRQSDFTLVLEHARRGDFFYFDPPYLPRNETSFTSYTAADFGPADHQRLADTVRELDRRGCFVMVSNSDNPLVQTLYRDFRIERIQASRQINCRASGRGKVYETLVRNYR